MAKGSEIDGRLPLVSKGSDCAMRDMRQSGVKRALRPVLWLFFKLACLARRVLLDKLRNQFLGIADERYIYL